MNYELNQYILYLFDIASSSEPLRGYVCPWPHAHSQPRVRSKNLHQQTYCFKRSNILPFPWTLFICSLMTLIKLFCIKLIMSRKRDGIRPLIRYKLLLVSYCKFWIYWVGVNTKFTIWKLVNFVFKPTQ